MKSQFRLSTIEAIEILRDRGVCPEEFWLGLKAIYRFANMGRIHVTEGIAVAAALDAAGFEDAPDSDPDADVQAAGFRLLHTDPLEFWEALEIPDSHLIPFKQSA